MIVALIPARHGSKGIPNKNTRLLGSLPLVEYTLRAAQGATRLDRIAVTTNDPEVASIAQHLGVTVIDRPESLARDQSPMIDALVHALETLAQGDCRPDAVMLLQPTSPFRTAKHIDQSLDQFFQSGVDSLVSVNQVSEHPCECVRQEEGRLHLAVQPPQQATGRQGYPEYLYINGAIYITRTAMLLEKRVAWDFESDVYIMPSLNSIDIDELYDWMVAEALLKTHSDAIGL